MPSDVIVYGALWATSRAELTAWERKASNRKSLLKPKQKLEWNERKNKKTKRDRHNGRLKINKNIVRRR